MRNLLTFLILTIASLWALSSAPALAQDEAPVHHLKLKKVESVKYGRVAAVAGEASMQGVRLLLGDTKANQPLQVTLISLNKETPLKLGIYRGNWDKPKKMLTTGKDGAVSHRYRSGKHTAFIVSGPDDAKFQLVLWVGPEVEPLPKNAITSMKEYEKKFGPQP
jgi:hypothetical protein